MYDYNKKKKTTDTVRSVLLNQRARDIPEAVEDSGKQFDFGYFEFRVSSNPFYLEWPVSFQSFTIGFSELISSSLGLKSNLSISKSIVRVAKNKYHLDGTSL